MQQSLDIIAQALELAKREGADAADALYYSATALSVSRRMKKPEGLERSESAGLGLRVFVKGKMASVSTSDMGTDTLQELATRAVAMAKLAPADPHAGLAPRDMLAKVIPELDLFDADEPTPEWLQTQCAEAEDAALATTGITNSEGADASYSAATFALGTSEGFAQSYRSSNASISVSVLAGEGTAMERDYDFTSARYVSDLSAASQVGHVAAKRALARLNSRKAASAQVPIIFDPRVAKSLLVNFASAINGASVARGTSFLKDAMGEKLFADTVTIIDDPHRARGLGSRPFDGEGVANRKRALVENGVLQGWLLDRRSASKLGLPLTGNATRGLSSPPSPSASNLYLAAGHLSPAQLMGDIKNGFYVTEAFGMGVNLVTGDYSQGASGFWIENGEKTFAVSEVTIAGKLRDMFARLVPANDLNFRYATNAPTLRIDGMTLAGS